MKRQPIAKVDASVDASVCESVNLSVPDIGLRIKAARKAVGLTQEMLAALAGAKSKSGLQDNEAGKNMPGGQMVGALVAAGINANWLLTGEGPMLLADLMPKPPKINGDALAAIIEGIIKAAPNASAEIVAHQAVQWYEDCIARGLITPDGIGDGGIASAA